MSVSPVLWAEAIINAFIIFAFTFFHVVGLVFLLRGKNRLIPVHQITANALVAHVLNDFSNYPLILYEQYGNGFSTASCWLHCLSQAMELHLPPFMLLMFSIERLMYIKNPVGHVQRFTRCRVTALLVVPWAASFILGLIEVSIGRPLVGSRTMSNKTHHWCFIAGKMHYGARFALRTVLEWLLMPGVCLIIAITVLALWFRYKRKLTRGMDYSMMGEDVATDVRKSVISVSVLNFVYMAFLFLFFALNLQRRRSGVILDMLISVFGAVEAVVWVCCLPAAYRHLSRLCCRRCCGKSSASEPNPVWHDATCPEALDIHGEDIDTIG